MLLFSDSNTFIYFLNSQRRKEDKHNKYVVTQITIEKQTV